MGGEGQVTAGLSRRQEVGEERDPRERGHCRPDEGRWASLRGIWWTQAELTGSSERRQCKLFSPF